jgi:DMSO/TMAO reductase YedYZ molybdopterin-dependent catalytic subunit
MILSRRTLLIGGAGALLTGCNKLNSSPGFRGALRSSEGLTMRAQRLISSREAMAREFSAADMSPVFRSNGTGNPDTPDYNRLAGGRFADWRLKVEGLVRRPLLLSLAQLQTMPRRTQITRHDCVEGWSAIGKWTGTPLSLLLDGAGLKDEARYIVFHCMDRLGGRPYYESIDLIDAFHPQTIVAWGMNDQLLPVPNGAPLRLRVERQLGYKQAKYIDRIEARATLAGLYGGQGGFWEDTNDYEWYAGI